MIEEIENELLRLETKHEIKILYAVESGSRAWGFASTDSDWDVRYIYIHQLDWYLRIDEYKDSQGEILANDLDLAGWELKKALRLFRKSNPPMLEWLRSPTVYLEQYSTISKLRGLSAEYFNSRSCFHHYLSMATGNFKEFEDRDTVKAKKYFYVLRPVLACHWIKRTNTMPPMEFRELVDTLVDDERIKHEIERLLARKISGEEMREEPKNEVLNNFLKQQIESHKNYVNQIEIPAKPATDPLDNLFKETIFEAWK